jgi:hypothetical protein
MMYGLDFNRCTNALYAADDHGRMHIIDRRAPAPQARLDATSKLIFFNDRSYRTPFRPTVLAPRSTASVRLCVLTLE